MYGVYQLILLLSVTLLPCSAVAYGQMASRVTVDQLSRPLTSASASPQPVSSSSRAATDPTGLKASAQSAPAEPTAEVVDACRRERIRGRQVEGTECAAILAVVNSQPPQPSGEGVLLQMFGQRANVTGGEANASAATTDADAVARQLSTGDPQGSGAAGAIMRRDAPPPNAPR
jgi:hypothetical protein